LVCFSLVMGCSMNISPKKRMQSVEDGIGKLFGKLTVTKFIGVKKTPKGANVPYVLCTCECGSQKEISFWDVKSGKTKTCGFNHPHYEDRSEPAFNMIYKHSYQERAIKKGISFEITKDQFRKITKMNCHYCGSPPSSISYRGARGSFKSGKNVSQYIYNGLDRKDPEIGYTEKNVVPCCGICNHAKHTMKYDDFIKWLDRVSSFRAIHQLIEVEV